MRESLIKYIQELQEEHCAFFVFKKAGSKKVQVLSQKDKILYKTPSDNLSYAVFNSFHNSDNQFFIYSKVNKEFNIDFDHPVNVRNDFIVENDDKNQHETLVKDAVEFMKTSSLDKVVLSRKYTLNHSMKPEELFQNMIDRYKHANVYYMNHPKIGCWMGATPELLLKVKGNDIETMSLAGTAVYKKGINHQWGNKEINEQQIVTDYIISQLKKTSCKNISVQDVETIQAGNLLHLKTDIKAQLSNNSVSDILNILHPTPAVCGFPTDKALNYIINNENYDREFYTGYFGIVNSSNDKQEYFVNLRSMQLMNGIAYLYAGGGITTESDPAKEFEETQSKLHTMATLFNR